MSINSSVLYHLTNNDNSITKRIYRIPKIVLAGILVLIIILSLFVAISMMLTTKNSLKVAWQQYLPGISGEGVIQTSDGGFLAVGRNASITEDDNPRFANVTSLAVKTDSYGNIVWAKTYSVASGITETRLIKVVETSDGYVLAGTLAPAAYGFPEQFCLIKIDFNGDIVWNNTYAHGVSDEYYELGGLISTSDGGYTLVGSFWYTPPSNVYLWFMKVDSAGKLQWNKTINYNQASSLLQTNDNGYVIISTQVSHGPFPSFFKITKIDPNGDEQWSKTFGGEGNFYNAGSAAGLATSDNGYLIAGTASQEDGETKGWLVKISTDGNMQWNKTYVYRSHPSTISSICLAKDGGYVFVGKAFELPTPNVFDSNAKTYTWITRIDDTGNVLGQLAIDMGNHGTNPKNIVQTSDGGYVFVGVWNEGGYEASSNQKFWLVKIAPTES
jgi:hypothetical protein